MYLQSLGHFARFLCVVRKGYFPFFPNVKPQLPKKFFIDNQHGCSCVNHYVNGRLTDFIRSKVSFSGLFGIVKIFQCDFRVYMSHAVSSK
jgi:hypothetical protein